MKVAIYSPYLDTMGGGERYMMTLAEVLLQENQVDLLLDSHLYLLDTEKLMKQLSDRFGLNLQRINLVKAPMGKDTNSIERTLFLTKYDLLIYLTDGSIFYPTATKNILHIQSPIKGQAAKNLWGKIKLSGWDLIIYNSEFTKKNSQKYWPLKNEVLYPPVDIESIKPLTKKKNILSVGRFFGFLKDKKHSVMIQAFKDMYSKKEMGAWSLNLVGSAGEGDRSYLETLKKEAKGFPVNFFPNLDRERLIKLYGESSIYWHAAGFEEEDPTKMEHFGISTVEAMAGGCVPVVIEKGGQVEIVENGKNGILWSSIQDLEQGTLSLVKDKEKMERLSKEAIERASFFSKQKFQQHLRAIIK